MKYREKLTFIFLSTIILVSTFGLTNNPLVGATTINYIENGNFESGFLSPWTTWSSSVASVTSHSWYVHSGSYGCELEEGSMSGELIERSSIQQYVNYVYSELSSEVVTFWMKSSGGGVTLRIFHNEGNSYAYEYFDSSETWIQITLYKSELVYEEDISRIKLTSKYDGYAVAVDDIRINTAELDNKDFESGILAPWTTWSSASASITDEFSHTGYYCCKLFENLNGINKRSSIKQDVDLSVDLLDDDALTFYMKCNGGGINVLFTFTDDSTRVYPFLDDSNSWIYIVVKKSDLYLEKTLSCVKFTSLSDGYKVYIDDIRMSDTSGPLITITSPNEHELHGRSVTMTYTARDRNDIIRYRVSKNGINWEDKGTETEHTFTGLNSKTYYSLFVEAKDILGNLGYQSVHIYVLDSGSYCFSMDSTHKAEWWPENEVMYAEETIVLSSDTYFNFDGTTGVVQYTSFSYSTEISFSGNFIDRAPAIGGLNFLFDQYFFRVSDYFTGDQHNSENPSGVWVASSDLYYGRELSLPIIDSFSENRLYITLELYSQIRYYNDVWSFDCWQTCNGMPTQMNCDFHTNTQPPSPLSCEWSYWTVSTQCVLT